MSNTRKVKKTYKFRAYCNKTTEMILLFILECCRWEYNTALSLKEITYNLSKNSIHKYSLINKISQLTTLNPLLGKVYSHIRQEVISRLDHNYNLFFKGLKENRKVGKPKFIFPGNYYSFTYQDPKRGFKLSRKDKNGKTANGDWRWVKLSLSEREYIYIKVKRHRAVKGKIKTLTVKRNNLGEWFVILVAERTVTVKPKTKSVGLDFGIKNLVHTSDNETIKNPFNFKEILTPFIENEKTVDRIVDCQRNLQLANDEIKKAKNEKDNIELKKWYKIKKARLRHLRLSWKRYNNLKADYLHKEAKKLVDSYNVICIEDFKPKKLLKKSEETRASLRKRLHSASCSSFKTLIFAKALINGNHPVLVPANNTTKTCSGCGAIRDMKLENRIHECKKCKLVIDRDYNASLNIQKIGLELLAA